MTTAQRETLFAARLRRWNGWDFPEPLVVSQWMQSRRPKEGEWCMRCQEPAPGWALQFLVPPPDDPADDHVTDAWVTDYWLTHNGKQPIPFARHLICGTCIAAKLAGEGIEWDDPHGPRPRGIAQLWRVGAADNEYLLAPTNRLDKLPIYLHRALWGEDELLERIFGEDVDRLTREELQA